MRLRLSCTIASVLLLLAPLPAPAGGPCIPLWSCYAWTVSFSVSDPFDATRPATAGTTDAYVWFYCGEPFGMSAAEFAVEATGGLTVLGFTPMNGYLNAGSATELLLAVGGCPSGPVPAGKLTLLDAAGTGGRVCLANSAANGLNVTVNCDIVDPILLPNGYAGLSTDGSVPCWVYSDCTIAVEPTSWGAVKALYR